MEEILEWSMVVELMDCLDDMTDSAQKFVKDLFDNLDPHEPFIDQMEGDGLKQSQWLYFLYEKHINEDIEAAQDIYEED